MDAEVLEFVKSGDPARRAQEIEIQIVSRLHKHRHDPRFIALGKRLEELKGRAQPGQGGARRTVRGDPYRE